MNALQSRLQGEMQDLRKRLTEEMEETGHSWLQRAQEGQHVLSSQVAQRAQEERRRGHESSVLAGSATCAGMNAGCSTSVLFNAGATATSGFLGRVHTTLKTSHNTPKTLLKH